MSFDDLDNVDIADTESFPRLVVLKFHFILSISCDSLSNNVPINTPGLFRAG